eukprot:GEMP01013373.1.p1 GENE.GEMP01013373.1~~GEMP01013373.1.p1  ORF type:complete len:544 (+),score=98.59 GEMP01013373.1:33-1664(+)
MSYEVEYDNFSYTSSVGNASSHSDDFDFLSDSDAEDPAAKKSAFSLSENVASSSAVPRNSRPSPSVSLSPAASSGAVRSPTPTPTSSPRLSPTGLSPTQGPVSGSPVAPPQLPIRKQVGNSVVEITKIWAETRDSLATFAADDNAWKLALKFMPWQGSFSGPQRQLLNHLRDRYSKMAGANGHRVVELIKHKCTKFDLNSPAFIPAPKFRDNIYDDNVRVVVDFANQILGGGFLTKGFVQEEIMVIQRFDMALAIAKRFAHGETILMEGDEAIIIKGADEWCDFNYYGGVPSDWPKKTKFHSQPKFKGTIIALDCLPVNFVKYEQKHLLWILRKAFVGFSAVDEEVIGTGHWGSGIFCNNKNVVLCLQFIAAALAGKQLKFYAFGKQSSSSIKGFKMVVAWHEKRTPISSCLNELHQKCQTDSDFYTQSPHKAKMRVNINKVRLMNAKREAARNRPPGSPADKGRGRMQRQNKGGRRGRSVPPSRKGGGGGGKGGGYKGSQTPPGRLISTPPGSRGKGMGGMRLPVLLSRGGGGMFRLNFLGK